MTFVVAGYGGAVVAAEAVAASDAVAAATELDVVYATNR
jgi:hypothetical protein